MHDQSREETVDTWEGQLSTNIIQCIDLHERRCILDFVMSQKILHDGRYHARSLEGYRSGRISHVDILMLSSISSLRVAYAHDGEDKVWC